jgi:hypothetical protein
MAESSRGLLQRLRLFGRHSDLSDPWRQQRAEMARRLEHAQSSGTPAEDRPGKGKSAITTILTYPDGSKWVRKIVSGDIAETVQDHEELTSWVSDAVDAGAPTVIRSGPDQIHMPFVDGEIALSARFSVDLEPYMVSDRGTRIGIMDYITGMGDRNLENFIVDPTDPQAPPVPIDHAGASYARNGAIHVAFVNRLTPERLSQIPEAEWDGMQRNLEALAPLFDAKGRPEWHQNMMDNFADLRSGVMRLQLYNFGSAGGAPRMEVGLITYDNGTLTGSEPMYQQLVDTKILETGSAEAAFDALRLPNNGFVNVIPFDELAKLGQLPGGTSPPSSGN